MKNIFLFAVLFITPSILISNNTIDGNQVFSNQSSNSRKEVSRDSINDQSNKDKVVVKKETLSSTEFKNLDIFDLSSLNFYWMNNDMSNFLVADIFSNGLFGKGIKEVKYIPYNSSYHFNTYSELKEEVNGVLETLKVKGDKLEIDYFTLDLSIASNILKNAKQLPKVEEFRDKLFSTTLYESDFYSKLSETNYSLYDSPKSSGNTDFDYDFNEYLNSDSNRDLSKNFPYGNSTKFIIDVDDDIVNYISKDTFRNVGNYSKFGSEWGYYANTYYVDGSNKETNCKR